MAKVYIAKVGAIVMTVATIVLGITLPETPWIDQNRAIYISVVALIALAIGGMLWLVGVKLAKSDVVKVSPIEDVKSDLITLNAREKETASQKARTTYPKETAMRIHDAFVSNYGNGTGIVANVLRDVAQKKSTDPLIEFFKKLGDVLDSVGFGLKSALEDDSLYKTTCVDLAKKRVKVKAKRKKKTTIQGNIDRVRDLSYGLSSSVLLRSVLSSLPETGLQTLSIVIATLEGIESAMEKSLNAMLNDLDNEWTISDDVVRGLETILTTLSLFDGLSKLG